MRGRLSLLRAFAHAFAACFARFEYARKQQWGPFDPEGLRWSFHRHTCQPHAVRFQGLCGDRNCEAWHPLVVQESI